VADATTIFDTTPPASAASSGAYSNATVAVSYTASDAGGGSGLAKVDLYVRRPGDATATKVATDTSPGSTGSFSYSADPADGPYAFYTVATDYAGNVEPAPAAPGSSTPVATTAP